MESSVFNFENYKSYINSTAKRGAFTRFSEALGVHTTLISHIFRGEKQLSLEQAALLNEYLGHSDLEAEYFMHLVQKEKAGNPSLRRYIEKQIKDIKLRSKKLSERLPIKHTLSEEDKAIFYSQWYYSALRILSSVERFQDPTILRETLKLTQKNFNQALAFLVRTGLCVEDQGKIIIGPSHTYLDSDSPLVARHHTNWRLKIIDQAPSLTSDDLMFTGPLSMSEKDALKFRSRILELVEELKKAVDQTEPENLYCFNVDWVKLS